jgi:hypothetical protein
MLRKAVVGFMVKERGVYKTIGSGTFVFHEGRLLIVSAAHVFEDLIGKGSVFLHVNSVSKMFELVSFKAMLSNMDYVNGFRVEDTLDIGAMIVPNWVVDQCNGHISMVEEDLIECEGSRGSVRFYQAIGYPGKKNDRLAESAARTKKLFSPEILIYSGGGKKASSVPDKVYCDEHNVIFEWNDKRNYDDNKRMVNVPDPAGISGGLIQGCFDYLRHSNGFYPTCAAGIVTEKNTSEKSMTGTRFSTIYEWLRLHNKILK